MTSISATNDVALGLKNELKCIIQESENNEHN